MKQGSLYSISGNQILKLEWLSFRCLFAIRPPASELRVELVISESSSKPMHQIKRLFVSLVPLDIVSMLLRLFF